MSCMVVLTTEWLYLALVAENLEAVVMMGGLLKLDFYRVTYNCIRQPAKATGPDHLTLTILGTPARSLQLVVMEIFMPLMAAVPHRCLVATIAGLWL